MRVGNRAPLVRAGRAARNVGQHVSRRVAGQQPRGVELRARFRKDLRRMAVVAAADGGEVLPALDGIGVLRAAGAARRSTDEKDRNHRHAAAAPHRFRLLPGGRPDRPSAAPASSG